MCGHTQGSFGLPCTHSVGLSTLTRASHSSEAPIRRFSFTFSGQHTDLEDGSVSLIPYVAFLYFPTYPFHVRGWNMRGLSQRFNIPCLWRWIYILNNTLHSRKHFFFFFLLKKEHGEIVRVFLFLKTGPWIAPWVIPSLWNFNFWFVFLCDKYSCSTIIFIICTCWCYCKKKQLPESTYLEKLIIASCPWGKTSVSTGCTIPSTASRIS